MPLTIDPGGGVFQSPSPTRARVARGGAQERIVTIDDMTGGLDRRRHPSKLRANRARRLSNWRIAEIGALVVRPGYRQLSTGSLGNTRIQGAQRVYLSSHTFTVAAWEGALYKTTDSGGWDSSGGTNPAYSTLQSSAPIHFLHDRDIVGVFDGANAPRKSTDGSTWSRLGIAAPSTDSTLAVASSGALLSTAEYEIGFTYEDNALGHESNGGVVSTITMGGTTGAIRIEVTGSSDPQVDSINIYARNKSAGETVRRKASSLTNPGASTASVLLDSSNWSANAPEPTTHGVPPLLTFGAIWRNRWWARHATIANRLHFSEVFQPQSWPGTFFLDFPFTRGDRITAVIPQGDTLVVMSTSDVFVVIGRTTLEFDVRPALNAQDGALGARAVEAVESGIFHAGATGQFIYTGAEDRVLGFDLEPSWRDMVANSAVSDLEQIDAVYHEKDKELRVAIPRGDPAKTPGEWILDLNRTRNSREPAWASSDRRIGGYVHWNGPEPALGDRGRLFTWTDTSGLLMEESVGSSAGSSQIVAEYEGPTMTLGLSKTRILEVWGEYEPAAGQFTVETVIDGRSHGQLTVPIGAGKDVYDTGTYDDAVYGAEERRLFHRHLRLSAEGRTVYLRATYQGRASFRWFSYAYTVRPEVRPREIT